MLKQLIIFCILNFCSLICQANSVLIDKDVEASLSAPFKEKYISFIVLFHSDKNIPEFIHNLKFPNIHHEYLNFMPAVIITGPNQRNLFNFIATFPSVRYIALNKPAGESIEINSQNKKIKRQLPLSGIDLWWSKGFKGQSGVVGIIDSGIAADHAAFANKKIIINKNEYSGFSKYFRGIRSSHGTGVACIYAGHPLQKKDQIRGVSYKAPIILSTIAGEGNKDKENYWLTYSGLNWFFSLNSLKPSIINYSFGNGDVSCATCPDWSGMSKVVDYIVNQHKVLWVTSAGNNGYIKQKKHSPYSSTLTIPADNYNALTVANMDMYGNKHSEARKTHAIRYTSSRGPTRLGRKKPDIAAPGNYTYTCAPDPQKYKIHTNKITYENGYRFMGGTSSAAPHVGGAILIIKESGINNPMAIKALLINSAHAWTDGDMPGPNDPSYPNYSKGHHPRIGSEWNPTYGWGYINMKNAFYQRNNIIEDKLSKINPVLEYKMKITPKDKITVVHERRVGFNTKGQLWNLSRLKLEIYDFNTRELLALDNSELDTVHQVSLCNATQLNHCETLKPQEVIIRITLDSSIIEGANYEPIALAYSTFNPVIKL